MIEITRSLLEVDVQEYKDNYEVNCYVLNKVNQITHLRYRGVPHNLLPKIMELSSLLFLDLCFSNISYLPKNIQTLSSLVELRLYNNSIECLPIEICCLTNLESLHLDHNNLRRLPVEIRNLTKLKKFGLTCNPIAEHTIEIAKRLDCSDLINYYLEVAEESVYLNEAKILVVGNERVGKTSIIKRIQGFDYNHDEPSTQGVDIVNFDFKGTEITGNIWDFAGQEITHQTHKFFFSKRCLYLFVVDSQIEDGGEDYHWLNVIKAYSANSPIIVIANKHDLNKGFTFDLNSHGEFNIVDVVYTSAKDNDNIDVLLRCIKSKVLGLSGIRLPLPVSWAKVKLNLEQMVGGNKDFLEWVKYEELCCEQGLTNINLQKTLLNILNEIGTIVSYLEWDHLSRLHIINPVWVTQAVYKIIRSEQIARSGFFSNVDFKKVFEGDEKYQPHHFNWLANLMNLFELSFDCGVDKILVPSRLPTNQPDFNLKTYLHEDGLNLRFNYREILKKSVIAQFIVKMETYIDTQQQVRYWKRGVFLQLGTARAVIISHEGKRVIDVAIDRRNNVARDFLGKIRLTLAEINQDLDVIEEIPYFKNGDVVGYADYKVLESLSKTDSRTTFININVDGKRYSEECEVSLLLDGHETFKTSRFGYGKFTRELFGVLAESLNSKYRFYNEKEDFINDYVRDALRFKSFNVLDQNRGGLSSSGLGVGERDFVILDEYGEEECIMEALVIKSFNKTIIERHLQKLCVDYNAQGHSRLYLLTYAMAHKFKQLWGKYKNIFESFDDKTEYFGNKSNLRVGRSLYRDVEVFHFVINYSPDE